MNLNENKLNYNNYYIHKSSVISSDNKTVSQKITYRFRIKRGPDAGKWIGYVFDIQSSNRVIAKFGVVQNSIIIDDPIIFKEEIKDIINIKKYIFDKFLSEQPLNTFFILK